MLWGLLKLAKKTNQLWHNYWWVSFQIHINTYWFEDSFDILKCSVKCHLYFVYYLPPVVLSTKRPGFTTELPYLNCGRSLPMWILFRLELFCLVEQKFLPYIDNLNTVLYNILGILLLNDIYLYYTLRLLLYLFFLCTSSIQLHHTRNI